MAARGSAEASSQPETHSPSPGAIMSNTVLSKAIGTSEAEMNLVNRKFELHANEKEARNNDSGEESSLQDLNILASLPLGNYRKKKLQSTPSGNYSFAGRGGDRRLA